MRGGEESILLSHLKCTNAQFDRDPKVSEIFPSYMQSGSWTSNWASPLRKKQVQRESDLCRSLAQISVRQVKSGVNSAGSPPLLLHSVNNPNSNRSYVVVGLCLDLSVVHTSSSLTLSPAGCGVVLGGEASPSPPALVWLVVDLENFTYPTFIYPTAQSLFWSNEDRLRSHLVWGKGGEWGSPLLEHTGDFVLLSADHTAPDSRFEQPVTAAVSGLRPVTFPRVSQVQGSGCWGISECSHSALSRRWWLLLKFGNLHLQPGWLYVCLRPSNEYLGVQTKDRHLDEKTPRIRRRAHAACEVTWIY